VPMRLLETIRAEYLLVSFPVHSLGGRSKGMQTNYGKQFQSVLEEMSWQAVQFIFSTELAYLIHIDRGP